MPLCYHRQLPSTKGSFYKDIRHIFLESRKTLLGTLFFHLSDAQPIYNQIELSNGTRNS